MTLPTRPLGSSGLDITTVGLGAWAIGGGDWAFGWGPQDDTDSLAAMHRALELGINWIDTAAVYGLGHSEELVGRLLQELPSRGRPLVFTQCGLVWDERDRMKEARRVLRPDSIRKECEASLRRLGLERIDLYQFHRPDETGTPVEDSWHAMVQLVEEGKVRAAGVSNFDVALLERCDAIRHVDSLQPPFSLIRRDVATDQGEGRLQRIHVTDRIAAFEQGDVEVRDARGPHFAFLDELHHRVPGVLYGGPRLVGPMELIEIDALETEPAQRRLALLPDGVRAQHPPCFFHAVALIPHQPA